MSKEYQCMTIFPETSSTNITLILKFPIDSIEDLINYLWFTVLTVEYHDLLELPYESFVQVWPNRWEVSR